MNSMMQGDARSLYVELLLPGDVVVEPKDVADVEITLGLLSKTYREGQLSFMNGVWVFPLTQSETLALRATVQKVQVRVRWPSGEIEGVFVDRIYIDESLSRKEI